jgi:hypothetical protein
VATPKKPRPKGRRRGPLLGAGVVVAIAVVVVVYLVFFRSPGPRLTSEQFQRFGETELVAAVGGDAYTVDETEYLERMTLLVTSHCPNEKDVADSLTGLYEFYDYTAPRQVMVFAFDSPGRAASGLDKVVECAVAQAGIDPPQTETRNGVRLAQYTYETWGGAEAQVFGATYGNVGLLVPTPDAGYTLGQWAEFAAKAKAAIDSAA